MKQPEQEPAAIYVSETWCGSVVRLYEDLPLKTPLYTTPPQRTWVGLTDEEIMNMEAFYAPSFYDFYVAIEAQLKSKNGFDSTEKNT